MRKAVSGLLDWLYPPDPEPFPCRPISRPFCERCGEPVAGVVDNPYQCSNCAGRVWHICQARAAYRADGGVLDWIHRLKYRSDWHCLPRLGDWLIEGYERFYANEDVGGIVPVPLHWRRFWSRGFNQSYELARRLSKHSGLPIFDVLRRSRHTAVQASLTRRARMRNCRGAFVLRKSGFDAGGRSLLLVDDVFTTGSTVNACARELRRAGAGKIFVLTVARGGSV